MSWAELATSFVGPCATWKCGAPCSRSLSILRCGQQNTKPSTEIIWVWGPGCLHRLHVCEASSGLRAWVPYPLLFIWLCSLGDLPSHSFKFHVYFYTLTSLLASRLLSTSTRMSHGFLSLSMPNTKFGMIFLPSPPRPVYLTLIKGINIWQVAQAKSLQPSSILFIFSPTLHWIHQKKTFISIAD